MLREFADWVSHTPLSAWLQDTAWVVPTSQSLHIVALSVVFASALVIDLRLLGIGRSARSVRQVVTTHLPWMWAGLVVLLLTGTVQTIAEPMRQFVTPAFWAKMFMIVVVATGTAVFAARVRGHAARWEGAAAAPAGARMFAVLSIALWVAIIVCGRFIGYTWSNYV